MLPLKLSGKPILSVLKSLSLIHLFFRTNVEPRIRHLLNFAVSSTSGDYLLTDYQAGAVFRYDRAGKRLAMYGGRRPGEADDDR